MRKILFVSFLLLQIFVLNSFGQFKLKIGPQTGMNFNIHAGRDLNNVETGFGAVIGGQVDISFNDAIGLITNLQFYDNRSGSSTDDYYSIIQTGQSHLKVAVRDKNSRNLAYILIEPLLKLSVPSSRLYFVLGPSFGLNIEGKMVDNITATFPEGYIFKETGTNKMTQNTTTTLGDLFDKLEFKFGSGYDISINNRMFITPQINLGYGITPVQHNTSWGVVTFQTMLALKFLLIK